MGLFNFITDDVLGLGFRKTERQQRRNLADAQYANRVSDERRRGLESRAMVQDARGLQSIIAAVQQSQGIARASAGNVRQATATAGRSRAAVAQTNAFDQGLVGTSGGRALTAAQQRDNIQASAGVEAQLAQLEAELGLRGGQAITGQRSQIANRFIQAGQGATQHGQNTTNLLGSINIDNQGGEFLKLLGAAAGAFI